MTMGYVYDSSSERYDLRKRSLSIVQHAGLGDGECWRG